MPKPNFNSWKFEKFQVGPGDLLRGFPGLHPGALIKQENRDKKDLKSRIPSAVKINEEDLPPEEREKREKERRWFFIYIFLKYFLIFCYRRFLKDSSVFLTNFSTGASWSMESLAPGCLRRTQKVQIWQVRTFAL